MGFKSSGPCVVGTIGTIRFLGPTVTQSSVVPDFDILLGVGIESTGEDLTSLRFLLGVGVSTVDLPLGWRTSSYLYGLFWGLSYESLLVKTPVLSVCFAGWTR